MVRHAGLLQSLGAAFCSATSIGRIARITGDCGIDISATERCLGFRWLSTSLPATAAALSSPLPDIRLGVESAREKDSPSDTQASTSASSSESAGADSGFNVGYRRVVSERRGMQGAQEGVVHIQNTFNNIILTLTDKAGSIKTYTSAGVVGYRGSRKSQPVAAEKAAEELARRALKLGYSSVAVRLKGPGSNKQYAVQSLAASGLQITSLAEVTGIPYNGCRPPKKRRV